MSKSYFVNTESGDLFSHDIDFPESAFGPEIVKISKKAHDRLLGDCIMEDDIPISRGEVQDEHHSQVDLVNMYLDEHKEGLTSAVAFSKLGISYLPSKIQSLSKKGIMTTITSERITKNNGKKVWVNRWRKMKKGEWFA